MTEGLNPKMRLLVSGMSEYRKAFFLTLLKKQLMTGNAAIVLDFEDTAAADVVRLCAEMHVPIRRQGSIISFDGWEPQTAARFIADALREEPDIQPALLYRFIVYLSWLYTRADQSLTMQELSECDMAHVQQAAYYYGADEIYTFMSEFSAPLMFIENALRRYGSMMSQSGGSLPQKGECLILHKLGDAPERQGSMQLQALHTALSLKGFPDIACFQWGANNKCTDCLPRIVSDHNGDYVLFARDAMSSLKEQATLLDDFERIVLLRHSNPESCRQWSEFMGVREVWSPTVSSASRARTHRLFRSLPLPKPDDQGALAGDLRKESNVSVAKQERYKIHPSRLTLLHGNKCVMIDRTDGSIAEVCLL